MKAISLWNPWAALIVIERKHYETRSWSTEYRGPLLIHAAKSLEGARDFHHAPIHAALNAAGLHTFRDIPFGAAVCVVDLVDVLHTEGIRERMPLAYVDELFFGDYRDGRYAWKLENVRVLKPFPMRGQQAVFNVEQVYLDQVVRQIGEVVS